MPLKPGSTTRAYRWLLPSRDSSSNPLKPSLNPAMANPPADRASRFRLAGTTHNQPKGGLPNEHAQGITLRIPGSAGDHDRIHIGPWRRDNSLSLWRDRRLGRKD